ncbi:MAG: arsinothricin resistance N-acetyltransferase ArsN1 family B [Halobacteriales archaeon]
MTPTLRLATPDDASAIRQIYAPIVTNTAISFELTPPSIDDLRQRIEHTLEQYPWLVCEADGELLGYATAGSVRGRGAYRWSTEVSVYVDSDFRRRNVATGLYTALLDCLAVQGYYSAYAVTALPNPASVRLHESMGFEALCTFEDVGFKHGQWHDIRWWHMELADRPSHPTPPEPPAAVRDAEVWSEALMAGIECIDLPS